MVKCLPCSHGKAGLISPNAGMLAQAYYPSTSTREAETKDSWGLLVKQSSLIGDLLANEKLSQKKVDSVPENGMALMLSSK